MSDHCIVCNKIVIAERVEFLKELGKEITCLEHALSAKVKAVYTGEHGTSDLIFCDRVYNDDVRSKFYDAEDITDEEEESDTTKEEL